MVSFYHLCNKLAQMINGVQYFLTFFMLNSYKDFKELNPNRERNWCCGGGGGLVAMPEFEDFRIKTGKLKMEQIKKTGAKIIVSPCENCRLQLGSLNDSYDLDLEINSMMDFVVNAMVV